MEGPLAIVEPPLAGVRIVSATCRISEAIDSKTESRPSDCLIVAEYTGVDVCGVRGTGLDITPAQQAVKRETETSRCDYHCVSDKVDRATSYVGPLKGVEGTS